MGFLSFRPGELLQGVLDGLQKQAGPGEESDSGADTEELVRVAIGQVHLHFISMRQRHQLPVTPDGSPLVL